MSDETNSRNKPHDAQSIKALIDRGKKLYPGDQLHFFLCLGCAVLLRHNQASAEAVISQIRTNLKKVEVRGKKTQNDYEWETLLNTKTPIEIADILERNSDESQRLRSNLRGYGILPTEQRSEIIRAKNEKRIRPTHFLIR